MATVMSLDAIAGDAHDFQGMGKKARLKKLRREAPDGADPILWASEDGVHALGIGRPPSDAERAAMTKAYQDRIRNSPLWDQMVNQFGAKKAAEMLKEFTVKTEGT